jgi:hypothetical protein
MGELRRQALLDGAKRRPDAARPEEKSARKRNAWVRACGLKTESNENLHSGEEHLDESMAIQQRPKQI